MAITTTTIKPHHHISQQGLLRGKGMEEAGVDGDDAVIEVSFETRSQTPARSIYAQNKVGCLPLCCCCCFEVTFVFVEIVEAVVIMCFFLFFSYFCGWFKDDIRLVLLVLIVVLLKSGTPRQVYDVRW